MVAAIDSNNQCLQRRRHRHFPVCWSVTKSDNKKQKPKHPPMRDRELHGGVGPRGEAEGHELRSSRKAGMVVLLVVTPVYRPVLEGLLPRPIIVTILGVPAVGGELRFVEGGPVEVYRSVSSKHPQWVASRRVIQMDGCEADCLQVPKRNGAVPHHHPFAGKDRVKSQ